MNDFPWEDGLLERKVESDLKDLLKTLVAFANSVKPGHVATLLIGEKDDGTVAGVTNPERIQQKVRDTCEDIYPDIVWRTQIYEKDSKHCVRVEIEYSGETPHFGAPAWVRRGSSSVKASDEVFQRLIDFRSSKIRELAMWEGKEISVQGDIGGPPNEAGGPFHKWGRNPSPSYLYGVNNFWVTLRNESGNKVSEPLDKVVLSFDNQNNRLLILIKY